MRLFAVQHRETLDYWMGQWNRWSPRKVDAQTFHCEQDAFDAAFARCAVETRDLEFVPLHDLTDHEIAQRNEAIVTAQTTRWLRQA